MVLSFLAALSGVMGMAMSFLFLGSGDPNDVRAGAAGFVAGSVLIGSGLLSLTILATREERPQEEPAPGDRPQLTGEPFRAEGPTAQAGFQQKR
jgi:hypothetical protein